MGNRKDGRGKPRRKRDGNPKPERTGSRVFKREFPRGLNAEALGQPRLNQQRLIKQSFSRFQPEGGCSPRFRARLPARRQQQGEQEKQQMRGRGTARFHRTFL